MKVNVAKSKGKQTCSGAGWLSFASLKPDAGPSFRLSAAGQLVTQQLFHMYYNPADPSGKQGDPPTCSVCAAKTVICLHKRASVCCSSIDDKYTTFLRIGDTIRHDSRGVDTAEAEMCCSSR